MIDVFTDELLTMTEAAKQCPKVRGKRPSTPTMWRWATIGKRGVKLQHVWVGRNILTTKAALNDFFNAVGNAPAREKASVSGRVPKAIATDREREIGNARKRLMARGMLPKETEH